MEADLAPRFIIAAGFLEQERDDLYADLVHARLSLR